MWLLPNARCIGICPCWAEGRKRIVMRGSPAIGSMMRMSCGGRKVRS
jgi:hypothetical protein